MQPHRVFQTPSARGALQPRSARKSAFAGRSPNPAPPPQRVHKLRQLFAFPSNSRHSNHLPPRAAFSPAALRLPAVYNVASGGLRESEFRPEERASGHTCPVHPWLTLLVSTKPSEFPGHACPEWVRYGRNYASTPDRIDMGAWVGRQQAFAVIAKKCSAAQALSLKQMKESCSYEKFGLSWDDFCQQHAGISRVHADRIIRRYEEFGEACFRLSSLARISPEGYREIADLRGRQLHRNRWPPGAHRS